MSPQKTILIAGPTGSGKSALALEMARRENGAIINADAMQVYAGLPILTNQPRADEQKEIPHELYAVLDPAERSSVGIWRRLALKAIEKTIKAGRRPILVGGTGLYFKALFSGLAHIPDIPEDVRTKTQTLYADLGEEKFRAALAPLDPVSAARIARNDRQRLMRAYEVAIHTGRPLSEWQKKSKTESQSQNSETHLLMLPRDQLYAACDARFLNMIVRGAVEEARQFMKRNLDPNLPAMKTIGLREIASHLHGELTLDQAIAKAQQATRNYAKRQVTWFRNQWEQVNPNIACD
jgi:tRNA dimethylallyltransferase